MNNDASARGGLSRAAKCGIVFLVIAVALTLLFQMFVVFLCGVSAFKLITDERKTFTKDGMSITLTKSFHEEKNENYAFTYVSEDVAVLVSQVPFYLIESGKSRTLNDYAELIMRQNTQVHNVEHKHTDGLNYLEYQEYERRTEKTTCYLISLYKSEDSFWMVTFVCSEEYMQEHRAELIAYAQSVSFE